MNRLKILWWKYYLRVERLAYKARNDHFARNLYSYSIFEPINGIFTSKRIEYIMRWKIVGEIEGDFGQKLDTGVQEITRRRPSTKTRPVVLSLLSLFLL